MRCPIAQIPVPPAPAITPIIYLSNCFPNKASIPVGNSGRLSFRDPISIDELKSYMDAPKKTYKDYKSQEYVYDVGAKFLKALGIEKGGKR